MYCLTIFAGFIPLKGTLGRGLNREKERACCQHTLVCGLRGNSIHFEACELFRANYKSLLNIIPECCIVPIRKRVCFDCVYCVTLQVQCYPCKSCEPEELKKCVNEKHKMFHCQDIQQEQVRMSKTLNFLQSGSHQIINTTP